MSNILVYLYINNIYIFSNKGNLIIQYKFVWEQSGFFFRNERKCHANIRDLFEENVSCWPNSLHFSLIFVIDIVFEIIVFTCYIVKYHTLETRCNRAGSTKSVVFIKPGVAGDVLKKTFVINSFIDSLITCSISSKF